MKKLLLLLFVLVGINNTVSAAEWWFTPWEKSYSVRFVTDLTQPNGQPFQYDQGGGEIIETGPVGAQWDEKGNFLVFEPFSKLTMVYDYNFKLIGTKDFKLGKFKEHFFSNYFVYSGSNLIMGDWFVKSKYLAVFQENKGLIGYYFFKEENNNMENQYNNRIIVIENAAFFFESTKLVPTGVVKWLERPVSEAEIISGKYLELIKSSENLSESHVIVTNNKKVEITSSGIIKVDGKVYEKSWLNLWNFFHKEYTGAYRYMSVPRYLGKTEAGTLWTDSGRVYLTDDELNLLGVINLIPLPEITGPNGIYRFWGFPNYSPTSGLFVLSYTYTQTGLSPEIYVTYTSTNITQIIPNWGAPIPK